jgi:hypothetical protein
MGDTSDLPTWVFGTIRCDDPVIWAAMYPWCSEYSPSAWSQIAGFTNPFSSATVAAVPAVPAAYTSSAPSVEEAEAQINQVLGQQVAQTQANTAAAVQAQGVTIPLCTNPNPDGSCPPAGLSMTAWLGIALVLAFAIVAIGGGTPQRYGR